jgi:hypothetical protein
MENEKWNDNGNGADDTDPIINFTVRPSSLYHPL